MDEQLLMKCDNTIYADEIVGTLAEHNIIARVHDESLNTVVGAYGAITGIAIFVKKKDYEEALALVSPAVQQRNYDSQMCPKCGSEDIAPLVPPHSYGKKTTTIGLTCLILPIFYLAVPCTLGFHSSIAEALLLPLFCLGFIVLYLGRHGYDNYQCHQCGHTFHKPEKASK